MTPTTRGILFMIAGTMPLSTQDAVTKLLTETYSPGEVMGLRGLASFGGLAVLVRREGGWRPCGQRSLAWLGCGRCWALPASW